MMNNEEMIIKYLDNQLNSEEKKSFEIELSSSEELQRELERRLVLPINFVN